MPANEADTSFLRTQKPQHEQCGNILEGRKLFQYHTWEIILKSIIIITFQFLSFKKMDHLLNIYINIKIKNVTILFLDANPKDLESMMLTHPCPSQ